MQNRMKRYASLILAAVLFMSGFVFVGCSDETETDRVYTLLLRDSANGTHYQFQVKESECTDRQVPIVARMEESGVRLDLPVSENPENMTAKERKELLGQVLALYVKIENGEHKEDTGNPDKETQEDLPSDQENLQLTLILTDEEGDVSYRFSFDADWLTEDEQKIVKEQIEKGAFVFLVEKDPALMSESEQKDLLAQVMEALTYVPPKATIFLDAGHGYANSHGVIDKGAGANSPYYALTGLYESDVNLAISLVLKDLLIEAGYEVIMSREGEVNEHLPINDRARMIKNSGADFAVSVHCNSAGPTAMGARVYWNASNDHAALSEKLAQSVADAINGVPNTTNKEAYATEGDYAVVRDVYIPSILVETCFLTNQKDAEMISDPQWANRMAQALLAGVENWFEQTM